MIEFIEIQKENEENFLLLRHPLNSSNEFCRIWVDKFTTNGLIDILKERPFKSIQENNYRYLCFSYGGNKNDKYGEVSIQITQNAKRLCRTIPCSMFFAQNISWLFSIENKIDLEYLIVAK